MREIRLYGSEGGGTETNRFLLPLSSLSLVSHSGAGLCARRSQART